MKKRTIAKVLATSVLALAASASQAEVVNAWIYTLNLEWIPDSAQFSQGQNVAGYPGSTTADKEVLSWGAKGANYKNAPNNGYNRSALEITVPTATSWVYTNGNAVSANMFTHYNAPIYEVYPSLEYAQLAVTIELALPGSNTTYSFGQKVFDVYFKETLNDGKQCAWGLCDDDIFAIIVSSPTDPTLDRFTESFIHDGYEYTFNYFDTFATLQPLSTAVCAEVGILNNACYGFTTPEDAKTAVHFSFSMTATPIPEPETYAMMLAGLGIVGAIARRRRNAV